MSRSGYTDGCGDEWSLICWRGAVSSAIKGRRGQTLLRELLTALDAMPEKKLIAHELKTAQGEFCALGVLGTQRGVDVSALDPEDWNRVADTFDIAPALAREIVWENDEAGWYQETPEKRWSRVRSWVASKISKGTLP